jgi:hypothetical protein
MEMEAINIVELIENNPITKLSKDYNVKLLTKIKETFTDFEQQLFLSSFYCYINCDQLNDFVIDLDKIWKWMGFSSKFNAKHMIEKNFIEEKNYKKLSYDDTLSQNFATEGSEAKKNGRGGHNKEIIMLNINTFKKFCLKAGTKKADEIHEYYLKMEELIQETINEECNELKIQLENKSKQLENIVIISEKEKEELKENTLLEQFPINTQCIYIGLIDNKTLGKPNSKMYRETVIKFGQSNNLSERVKTHKKTYENFRLYNAFKVKNKIEIENCIKKHSTLKNRLRIVTIDDIAHRELIALDDDEFTLDKVEQLIKDIIRENEYNIENYNLLLKKNDELQNEIYKLKDEIKEQNKLLENNNKKIQKLEYDVTDEIKSKIASNYAICKYGYFIYAYQYENMRFICSITRQKDYDTILKNLKELYPSGEMVCQLKCSYPLTEKNMMFILKQNCVSLGQNKFETSSENIKKILDVSVKLEELLIEQSKDIDTLFDFLSNNKINSNDNTCDPEVPNVRKSKRPIDKINKDTGEVIATYESIEAAGRSCGLTTGTAIGLSVRENRVCQGFLWRYSGVSKEQQFADQPVIKICCKNGEKCFFKNIADAAKDANVSAPALRRRILTDVHVNNNHWVFDKTASHYN